MGWWKQKDKLVKHFGRSVSVKEDDNGELFIQLSDEMLDSLSVRPGDDIIWIQNSDGSWTIKKHIKNNKGPADDTSK